jgi:transposase
VHSRRYLINVEECSPQEVAVVLEIIGQLYQLERLIVDTKLSGDKKRQYRLENSKLLVYEVFSWLDEQCQRHDLIPKHPLTKSINYLQARETELRVFLADPDVPMDTNHLEREIRPIPLGKNYFHTGIMYAYLISI